jgi:YHS domain-containing protein
MKLFKTALVLAILATFSIGLVAAYAQPQPGGETKKPEPPKKEEPKKVEPKKDEPKKDEPKKDEPKKDAEKPMCPVSGKPVNFAVSTMTDDGPVYFCCPDCLPKYKADAKKLADKVAEQRKILAKMPRVQVACPVCGMAPDKAIAVDKVLCCSKECAEKYKKDAEKMKGKVEGCYTYQTKCPVTGKDIDPKISVTAKNGAKVYFCSKDCVAKFEKETAKYLPELAKQGYTFKAEDFKAGEVKKEEPKKEEPKKEDVKKPEPPKAEPKPPTKPDEKKPEPKKP